MNNSIDIPKTKEYGWILQDSGKRVFNPTVKSIWKRINFIVETRGGKVIPRTSGFDVEGGVFSKEDMDLIKEEISRFRTFDMPEDIELDKDGREQPNFDNDPLGSL